MDIDLPEKVATLRRKIPQISDAGVEIETKVGENLWPIPLNHEGFRTSLFNFVNKAVAAIGPQGKLTLGFENVILNENFTKNNTGSRMAKYVLVVGSGLGMSKAV